MLDDIMSTLFHIHYDSEDPLENAMLVQHVKGIIRNTWKTSFYKIPRKIPAIPERAVTGVLPHQSAVRPQVETLSATALSSETAHQFAIDRTTSTVVSTATSVFITTNVYATTKRVHRNFLVPDNHPVRHNHRDH